MIWRRCCSSGVKRGAQTGAIRQRTFVFFCLYLKSLQYVVYLQAGRKIPATVFWNPTKADVQVLQRPVDSEGAAQILGSVMAHPVHGEIETA